MTEATLPIEQRGSQRRYTQLNRFNVFLPPSGRYVLTGPESSRLPTRVDGPYMVLLRIEVSDDREGDSDLAAVGAGFGIVHSGAVAGFPLPVLRYYVGRGESLATSGSSITLLEPEDHALVAAEQKVTFVWAAADQPSFYRLDIEDDKGTALLAALLPQTLGMYRAPSWLREKAPSGKIRWRVVSMDAAGSQVAASPWREFVLAKNH